MIKHPIKLKWKIISILALLLMVIVGYSVFFNNSLKKNTANTEIESSQIAKSLEPIGKTNAKLDIVILADYECFWCRQYFDQTIKPFLDSEINKYDVSLRYDLFANINSPSLLASEAAYCANEQGKFWEANEMLWQLKQTPDNTIDFSYDNIINTLSNINLDQNKLKNCLDTHKYRDVILERSQWYVNKYQSLGFPTTFLNGKPIQMMVEGRMQDVGAISLSDFIQKIEQAMP